jgi:hypothetical protein
MIDTGAGARRDRGRAAEMPAWAAVGMHVGGAALLLALFGLTWDVAYHLDHGRDVNLFTPAHVLILIGLAGIGGAPALSVPLATWARTASGWRIGQLRVPYSALPMLAMAGTALVGFALDDEWHRTYGIDVTLWSPTHLMMIAGGTFANFTVALFPVEGGALDGRPRALRLRRVMMLGGVLLGFSGFLLEFDFGVPQWQALSEPLLIAITAGVGLVAARAALGPGAAVAAALFFLLMRGVVALVVGGLLGHSAPRFPLFLGSAIAVEAAFWLARRQGAVVAALLAGLLVGTAGMASEWAWSNLWSTVPWSAALLPRMWMPLCGAVLAAVPGLAAGAVLGRRALRVRAPLVVGSILGIAALLALPLARSSAPVHGSLATTPAGPERFVEDRLGHPAVEQDVDVEVMLSPDDAAAGADWFEVVAWQGGGQRAVPLVRRGDGRYRTAAPVPTGASWKAIVYLARGDVLVGLPISMPADPEYGQAGVPAEPERDGDFVPVQELMTSEAHGGPPLVAAITYAALLGTAAAWVVLLLLAYRAVGRGGRPAVSVERARLTERLSG